MSSMSAFFTSARSFVLFKFIMFLTEFLDLAKNKRITLETNEEENSLEMSSR